MVACPEIQDGKPCALPAGHTEPHRLTLWKTPSPGIAGRAGGLTQRRLVALLAFVVIGMVGIAVTERGSRPATPRAVAPSSAPAPVAIESLMSVAVTECNEDDARGTVSNGSTSTVDIYITVHFVEISGVLSDDGIDSVSNVRPGETARWEASYLGSGSFASCRAEVKSAFVQ